MTTGFNLITHPWIPVQTKTGFSTLSLEELFAQANEVTDIVEEAKTRHAIYLFLAAICHEATFQALGEQPTEESLPLKEDAHKLMDICQNYLKSPEAHEAFKDDTAFLSPTWPDFVVPQKEGGYSPEQIKGDKHLSPEQVSTPESLFRSFLGLQAFYPWGPETGSQRMDGYFYTTLLGPSIASSLWLNLHFLTTKGIQDAAVSQTEELIYKTGRCAWAFDINTPNGRTNWVTTKVGSLTPLFTFLERNPTDWEFSGSKKWDLRSGKFSKKDKGIKSPRPYPDQIGDNKIDYLSNWHWKYILGRIEGLKSKIHRGSENRMFTIRVVGVPNTGTGVRNSTLEKTYHFGGNPEETTRLLTAFQKCDCILKKVSTGILDKTKEADKKCKRTPLKTLAISRIENIVENSWHQLASPEENAFEVWKADLSQAISNSLNQLPASSGNEFKSIEKTRKEIRKILSA